ncbi:hypothetical protein GE061_014061 [Apolygus lucorum]|uniref:DUF7041 domain-containing protein n=1 Tax=Apolygus lucorum TaxID=248454 RepID=A0A8S9XRT4_APOLU|nr:hypothetical protein GE061_014061 [Apolygus lucorum]
MDNLLQPRVVGGGDGITQDAGNHQQNSAMHSNFKPPPFWKANVHIWFKQLEAQFRVKNIVSDDDKYDLIISAIDSSVLTQVTDLVIDPTVECKYEALKERLISCYCESEEKKLQMLLKGISSGEKKPSQLLREMRELANRNVSEELLKSMWLQQLPSSEHGISP